MAYVTNAPVEGIRSRFARAGRAVLKGLERFFVSAMENNSRMREIERLRAMSDEDLASRGLTRDRIAMHVFRDVMTI